MALSRKAKSLVEKSVLLAGALPLAVGAGTVLFGGLSGAFNAISSVDSVAGVLAVGAGAAIGGAASVVMLYKAINKSRGLDAVAGALLLVFGGAAAGVTGAGLGATGGAVMVSYATPSAEQPVTTPAAPARGYNE